MNVPNQAPTASFTVAPTSGDTDTSFQFDASGSSDPEDASSALQVRWDWDGDNNWDTTYSTSKTTSHTFNSANTYPVKMQVKDNGELMATTTRSVVVIAKSVTASNFAPTPKTGQTTSYTTGDDGDLKKGVAWPDPRFSDNGDGTVTDGLTGLIWMKNADCFGKQTWANALSKVAGLNNGKETCSGYTGKHADWHLPDRKELFSLIDAEKHDPALPSGHPFSDVQSSYYWSSTSNAYYTDHAWYVYLYDGYVNSYGKTSSYYVWPVRGGQ